MRRNLHTRTNMRKGNLSLILLLISFVSLSAQSKIGTGAVAELYTLYCAACHGEELKGGLGPNLVDETWIQAETDEQIASVIRKGVLEKGMIPYLKKQLCSLIL